MLSLLFPPTFESFLRLCIHATDSELIEMSAEPYKAKHTNNAQPKLLFYYTLVFLVMQSNQNAQMESFGTYICIRKKGGAYKYRRPSLCIVECHNEYSY